MLFLLRRVFRLLAVHPAVRALIAVVVASVWVLAPARAADTQVSLLDAGSGKKAPLRFAPKVGASQVVDLSMDMSMAMNMSGMDMPSTKMPTMVMTMSTKIAEVLPDGNIRYTFVLDKADVVAGENPNPMMIEAMRSEVSKMTGMSGTTVVTDRGATISADFALPPGADPGVLENMKKSVQTAGVPLPAEPVGKGARWQVRQDIDEQGMKLTQISTYTLQDIAGSVLTLDVTLTQKADPQTIDAPGVPPGSAKLKNLTSTGGGRTVIDLGSVMPRDATMGMKMSTQMEITAEGETMGMGMDMSMDMSIRQK